MQHTEQGELWGHAFEKRFETYQTAPPAPAAKLLSSLQAIEISMLVAFAT
jgi:hypothetical protein